MVGCDTAYSFASPRAVAPVDSFCRISVFCSVVRASLRPSFLPSAFARASPACVRSMSRSRSNWETAASTVMCSFPDALIRSTPLSARQWTCPPISAGRSTVASTSVVLRPSRSSLVTTSLSPSSNRSSSFEKPGALRLGHRRKRSQ